MSIRQMYPGSIVKPGFNPLSTLGYVAPYDLFTWGNNDFGNLGRSTVGAGTHTSSPIQVGSQSEWADFALGVGAGFGVAIKSNGTMWSWGYNAQGQLGQNNLINRSSPVQIGALTTWASAAISPYNGYAIKTDGTLWSWGDSTDGQIGDGLQIARSSPVQVGALTNWLSVSAGPYCFLAVKTDGTLWGVGRNSAGRLGLGDLVFRSSPVQVGALTTWASVNTNQDGATHAITTSGALYSWGEGAYGVTGRGSTTSSQSPIQIGSLSTWSKVSGKGQFTLATKTDGSLWAWGSNAAGAIGDGTTTSRSSPVQVGSLYTWSKVFGTGGGSSFAIKTDGTLWAWGNNNSGQLGLNNLTYRSSPNQVGLLTSWFKVGGGDNWAMGLN